MANPLLPSYLPMAWEEDFDDENDQDIEEEFPWVDATTTKNLTAKDLKSAIQKAQKSNPEGVYVVDIQPNVHASIAGYLGFENTKVYAKFVGTVLFDVLEDWRDERMTSVGRKIRSGVGETESSEAAHCRAEKLFQTIMNLNVEEAEIVRSGTFPITHDDLQVSEESDAPMYFCWLSAMHKVMEVFPIHFPGDESATPGEIHSMENWNRAYLLLSSFWKLFGKGGARGSNIKSNGARDKTKPALKPLFLNNLPKDVNLEDLDITTAFAESQRARYHEEANKVLQQDEPDHMIECANSED